MAVRNFICVLTFISAVTAASGPENPSLSLIAELLLSPAQDSSKMEYCSPTLQEQVTSYSESHSRTPLLCLQVSHLSQANHKNEQVFEVITVMLEIRGTGDDIRIIVENIQWNTSIAAIIQLPHESKVLFDNTWTDSPDYQRWKHFLLKKLQLPSSYFRDITPHTEESFPRLRRNANDAKGTSRLLAAIAQNVDRGLLFAQSLKARIEDTVKQTNTAKRRIKKLSSTLDNKKAASVDIVQLQSRGTRVERLLTSINEEITMLQKGKQDLKYDIDDFYVQLNAANISQEHRDKGPLYQASFNGDSYAMLDTPVYGTSFSFSIVFRSSTPNGLLFFSSNNSMEFWYSFVLLKGKLVFRYKLADGVVEFESSAEKLNDDKWHRVDAVKTTGSLQFYVDQKLVASNSVTSPFLSSVTWGPLYIGGVPDRPFYQSQGISITSFTGCLQNITFNQKLHDFRNSIGLKNIVFACTREGKVVPAKPYYFNGNGYASYKLPNGEVGRNFSLKLKFKTTKREGILFSASSSKRYDALALEMKYGKLLYYLDNGDGGFMVQYQQKKLNDNKWHTILAEKQGNFLRLTVDNDPPETARFAGTDQNTNTNPLLYIGGLPPGSRIPDGLTTDTKFLGCLQLQELENRQCKLFQLQECTL